MINYHEMNFGLVTIGYKYEKLSDYISYIADGNTALYSKYKEACNLYDRAEELLLEYNREWNSVAYWLDRKNWRYEFDYMSKYNIESIEKLTIGTEYALAFYTGLDYICFYIDCTEHAKKKDVPDDFKLIDRCIAKQLSKDVCIPLQQIIDYFETQITLIHGEEGKLFEAMYADKKK